MGLRMLAAGACGLTLVFIGAGAAQATTVAAPATVVGFTPTSSVDLDFGGSPLGEDVGPQTVTLTNGGTAADSITNATFSGVGFDDYLVEAPCTNVAPGSSCTVSLYFFPGALGSRPATINLVDSDDNSIPVSVTGTGNTGYYEVSAEGDIGSAGSAPFYGPYTPLPLNAPIVALTPTGDNGGYWLVAADGGIFSYGNAHYFGSTGNLTLNKPIVGMAQTTNATSAGGSGYYLVASDGGIFSYGNAVFRGSTGNITLNKPVVGMAVTPDDGGYYLVASDGGIFAYGDAKFYGSTGNITLNKPIVGMAITPDGKGYWMVASDGGIFAFGDAHFYGSTGNLTLNAPIVGMAASPTGNGYWMAASDGGLFDYGDAPFYGSGAGEGITDFVGIASNSPPTQQAIFDEPALRSHFSTSRTLPARMAEVSR